MNKTAIKNYAIWARKKLIADIEYKANLMGVSVKGIVPALPQSTSDVQFFDIGTKEYAVLKGQEIHQRDALVAAIRNKSYDVGYEEAYRFIVEKIAYTWFNRLIAIRFMEVNNYIPSGVRVLSSVENDKAEPDMVTTPFKTDLPFTEEEQDYIIRLQDDNQLDKLFRWMFLKQCYKLHEILPMLFDPAPTQRQDKSNDYLELLLTLSFIDSDGIVWHLVHDIREQDFRVRTPEDDERQRIENIPEEDMPAGQVEIIGWMYQYYNTEPKDKVFADLKKNIKISKDKIPAATQLFTPDWIVRYMVENSLGRLYIDKCKNEGVFADGRGADEMTWEESEYKRIANEQYIAEQMGWKYYLPEAVQTPEVREKIEQIQSSYVTLRPDEIKVIDPCMGSGHALVYMFDVLMQIYESHGWTRREAVKSILENNLWGLDIDDRASQLAYFAVMMKARQYDRRFFSHLVEPHTFAISESNGIHAELIDAFANGNADTRFSLATIVMELHDAKEYGSILNVTEVDFDALYTRLKEIEIEPGMHREEILNRIPKLLQTAQALAQKYDVVVTNPPYMGSGGMGARLAQYVKDHFPDSKSDLFAVFIEQCGEMLKKNGCQAMITQHAWMFLSSFEKLRVKLLQRNIVNMAHLGARAFEEIGGEVVQTTAFVLSASGITDYKGTYCRLIEPTTQQGKEDMFLTRENRYTADQTNFSKIPGSPVAYWVKELVIQAFNQRRIGDYIVTREGMATANNDRFLRYWYELEDRSITYDGVSYVSGMKWVPYNKGGEFRKWFGNNDYVVNWENDGKEIKENIDNKTGRIRSHNYNGEYGFKEGVTWSAISSGSISLRYCSSGFLFDSKGAKGFTKGTMSLYYFMSLVNSKVGKLYLSFFSPTMDFKVGDVILIPVYASSVNDEHIERLAKHNTNSCKKDWDSFETSWDFQLHPFIRWQAQLWDSTAIGATMFHFYGEHLQVSCPLELCYLLWQGECNDRFNQLKANEEELNRIFIDIYGLQDELTPEVEDKDITVRRADLQRDIRSFISYAVGCMFGRYSLDVEGLAYAGGEWDGSKYQTYLPDDDNCLPITDEDYGLKDDVVERFVRFVRTVYGAETLEENLDFIAKALGNRGNTSREVIRNYFLNDFFKDHCKIYQKRPIYWLFDSGKANGFKALVYMHRWNADTVGNLRVEYLHRMQRVYEKEIDRMQDIMDNSKDNRDVNLAAKRREKLVKQLKEARDYDTRLAHIALSRIEIDLDDGVKVNYEKVQQGPDGKSLGILAKI